MVQSHCIPGKELTARNAPKQTGRKIDQPNHSDVPQDSRRRNSSEGAKFGKIRPPAEATCKGFVGPNLELQCQAEEAFFIKSSGA